MDRVGIHVTGGANGRSADTDVPWEENVEYPADNLYYMLYEIVAKGHFGGGGHNIKFYYGDREIQQGDTPKSLGIDKGRRGHPVEIQSRCSLE